AWQHLPKVLINRPISNRQGCCTSSQNSGPGFAQALVRIPRSVHLAARQTSGGWARCYDALTSVRQGLERQGRDEGNHAGTVLVARGIQPAYTTALLIQSSPTFSRPLLYGRLVLRPR